ESILFVDPSGDLGQSASLKWDGANLVVDGFLNANGLSGNDGSLGFGTAASFGGTATVALTSTAIFGWSTDANWFDGFDIGLGRHAANVLEINDGTAGAFCDLML